MRVVRGVKCAEGCGARAHYLILWPTSNPLPACADAVDRVVAADPLAAVTAFDLEKDGGE